MSYEYISSDELSIIICYIRKLPIIGTYYIDYNMCRVNISTIASSIMKSIIIWNNH